MGMFIACKKKDDANNLPDMRVTLASGDTKPMGGKVFKTITEGQYEDLNIEKNAIPFNEWYRNYFNHYSGTTNDVYFLVTPILDAREKEAEEMLRFVKSGNTLFVATNKVSEAFRQSFSLHPTRSDSVFVSNNIGLTDTYLVYDSIKYSYYFKPLENKLDTLHTYLHQPIAYNEKKEPTAIQVKIGKGELIIITNAEALSNYFLLTRNNYNYALHLLSYVTQGPDNVYWDEFYHRNLFRQPEDSSVFDAIFSVPALRWAFWLMVLLCAIAIITHMARRQRMIPVRVANKNTTVEFTQTIARLYYNQKDNRNIALKMIQHFLENIRAQHYLPSQKLNPDFARILAGKTNSDVEKTEKLVAKMAAIQDGAHVSDDLLLWLNREITDLHKPPKAK
jgi:hypothetical protein